MNQNHGSRSRPHPVFSETLVFDDKLWIGLVVVKHNKLPKATSSRLRYNTVVPNQQDHSQPRP